MASKFTVVKQKEFPEGFVPNGRTLSLPWLELKPGDAFFVPNIKKQTLQGSASNFRKARKLDWRFVYWEAEEEIDEDGMVVNEGETGTPTKGFWAKRIDEPDNAGDGKNKENAKPSRDNTGDMVRAIKDKRP